MVKKESKEQRVGFSKAFWIVIVCIFLLFAVMCVFLFGRISKEAGVVASMKEELLVKNRELNAQVARDAAEEALALYRMGRQKDAVYALQAVYPNEETNMPYVPEVQYALTEAMGVYASNTGYVPVADVPFQDGVKEMSLSPDRTLLAVRDYCDAVTIFDTESFTPVSFIDDLDPEVEPLWAYETFFYVDKDRDILCCDATGERKLIREGDFSYIAYLSDRNLYCHSGKEIIVINPDKKEFVRRFSTKAAGFPENISQVYLTSESVYLVSYNTLKTVLFEYSPDGKLMKKFFLDNADYCEILADGSRFYYLTQSDMGMRELVCFDAAENKEAYRIPIALNRVNDFRIHTGENSKHILVQGQDSFYMFTPDGICENAKVFDCDVVEVVSRSKSDNLRIFLQDNTYRVVSIGSELYSKESFYETLPSLRPEFIKPCSDRIFVKFEGTDRVVCCGVSKYLQEEYLEDTAVGVVNRQGTLKMIPKDVDGQREYVIYDFTTGEEKYVFRGEYHSFAFVEDGSEFMVLYGAAVDVYSVEDGSLLYSFANGADPLFSSDYDAVYLPGEEEGIYSLKTGKKVGTMMNKADAEELTVVLGASGNTYAILTEDLKNILLYETKTRDLIAQESISLERARDVFFSNDGKYLGVLLSDSTLEIYNGKTLKKVHTFMDMATVKDTEEEEVRPAAESASSLNLSNDNALWYVSAIGGYLLDTPGRDYVLNPELSPVAELEDIVGFRRDKMCFIRENGLGYWYVPYVSMETLMQLGAEEVADYTPEKVQD